MSNTSAKPRMTLDDVIADMRAHGLSMGKKALSDCLKSGVFPFGTVLGAGPTGRTTFLILRKNYEAWAKEFLYPQ